MPFGTPLGAPPVAIAGGRPASAVWSRLVPVVGAVGNGAVPCGAAVDATGAVPEPIATDFGAVGAEFGTPPLIPESVGPAEVVDET